ncbi:unnamed protein product, partial [Musa acuminata var. zebrina]
STFVVSSRLHLAAAAADERYDLVLAAASGSLGAGRERRDQPADEPAASRLAPTESEPESGDLRVPLAPDCRIEVAMVFCAPSEHFFSSDRGKLKSFELIDLRCT